MRLQKKSNPRIYALNYQIGRGHIPVYRGQGGYIPVYRGQGGGFALGRLLGSITKPFIKTFLPKIVKTIVPRMKPIAKEIGKKVLNQSLVQAEDVLTGKKKIKHAVKDLGKFAVNETANIAVKKMRGGGAMRKKHAKIKQIGKRKRKDIFSVAEL